MKTWKEMRDALTAKGYHFAGKPYGCAEVWTTAGPSLWIIEIGPDQVIATTKVEL